MTDPVLLPCNHNLCLSCLSSVLDVEKFCPICNLDLSDYHLKVSTAMSTVCEWFAENKNMLSLFVVKNLKQYLPNLPNLPNITGIKSPLMPRQDIELQRADNPLYLDGHPDEADASNSTTPRTPLQNENENEALIQKAKPSVFDIFRHKPHMVPPVVVSTSHHRESLSASVLEGLPIDRGHEVDFFIKSSFDEHPETPPPEHPELYDFTWAHSDKEVQQREWNEDNQVMGNNLILKKPGWHLEAYTTGSPVLELEDTNLVDGQCSYRDTFFGKPHVIYVGGDANNPIFVAVELFSPERPVLMPYKALVRTKNGDERAWLSDSISTKQRLKELRLDNINLFEAKNPQVLGKEMADWEQKTMIKGFKFGVLYCKADQTKEGDMLNNEHGSPEFESFLACLGTKIELMGWSGYSGGLNTKKNLDGEHSVWTQFGQFEIMFHVSTFMKFRAGDRQQLDRKRHIGNDVVALVFMEGDPPLDPGFMRSQFNHIFIAVRPTEEDGITKYQVAVVAKEGVHPFGPHLEERMLFEKGPILREFLLTKMVNAERAAIHAPGFKERMSKARQVFLANILEQS